MDAFDAVEFDVAGRRRAADPRERAGRVETFEGLGDRTDDLVPADDAQVVVGVALACGADVAIYLVRLADVLGVDLVEAAHVKLDEGERRYDAATYRGSIREAPPLC